MNTHPLIEAALMWEQSQGARIESVGGRSAVIVTGHKANHVLHLVLTLFTFGLWLPGWLIMAAINGNEKRWLISLGPDGVLHKQWAQG